MKIILWENSARPEAMTGCVCVCVLEVRKDGGNGEMRERYFGEW